MTRKPRTQLETNRLFITNMPGRGRGRSRRSAGVSRAQARVNRLERSLHFQYPRGRADPPRVVDTPAWPLVVALRATPTGGGTTTYTTTNIVNGITSQLGINDITTITQKFSIRLSRVDVWTSPNIAQPVALRLADVASGVYGQWVEDIGTDARPAHVHAVWPLSQQQRWIAGTDTSVRFQVDHYASADLQIHIHLHVMFTAGDPVPSYRRNLPDIDPDHSVASDFERLSVI